ncbi:hypothetical protein [Longispora sp. K20-0274]|uniref:competence protein CoiA family protein n=1 Tax=Longispora sp. K20-0274 TaxID=3088255 RepID=UPI0039996EB7
MAPPGGHHPETAWHSGGKLLIHRWATAQTDVAQADLEWRTDDDSRRADASVALRDGTRLAFELQRRQLTDAEWLARHEDYIRQGIRDIWLWHPTVPRPGILLERGVDVWYLDPAKRELDLLVARGHPRRPGWHTEPDLARYATHHPPCLGDPTECWTVPLDEASLGTEGIRLPSDTIRLIRAQHDTVAKDAAERSTRLAAMRLENAIRHGAPSTEMGQSKRRGGRTEGATAAPPGPDHLSSYVASYPPSVVPDGIADDLPSSPPVGKPFMEAVWRCPKCQGRTRLQLCLDCEWGGSWGNRW